MPKRILIDATHREETRVVVLENGKMQEFESETSIKQQLKGNIYLAKVTRVEPSLQAAFVEYGGEKHGFLPFSEIHPDYYNIPVHDKEELLSSIRKEAENSGRDYVDDSIDNIDSNAVDGGEGDVGDKVDNIEENEERVDNTDAGIIVDPSLDLEGDDESILKNSSLYRKYKIQEVIKRNQIILVQVEKEERGNKGASLTTFVSLAGRYCVLMPNSLRQGGISRRIVNFEDRKKLKSVISELKIPKEMGIIVRTAGASKDDDDIKNDYNYLAKLWNEIRTLTLSSDAPAFIHAEGDVIIRTVRDIYDETYDEVLIEGDEAYKSARNFMQVVMPKHISKVKNYRNKVPLFSRYKIEEQISMLYEYEVPLESGGSIVINPTEALISIDVNSGKSTTQRSVEDTATSTNLEAAYEIARQLRLRDLSGLIVVDFIDMMDGRNRKSVERAIRDAFQNDRAKVQIGRISLFGLLEMSRQRLRASFLEVNTQHCQNCRGSGFVKAPASTAVTILRAIENEASRTKGGRAARLDVYLTSPVAMYILNYKRNELSAIEKRYNVSVLLFQDDSLVTDCFAIERALDGASVVFEPAIQEAKKNSKNNHKRESSGNVHAHKHVAGKQKHVENKMESSDDAEKDIAKKIGVTSIFEGLWKKIID